MIYIDTSKPVGDPDHIKVFANAEAAAAWFAENDLKAWRLRTGMRGCRPLVARNPVIQREVNEYGIRYIRSDAHGRDFGRRALNLSDLCRRTPGVSLMVFPRPQAEPRC
jgi:hypothetical protein